MPNEAHLPDLAYASEWLEDISTRLKAQSRHLGLIGLNDDAATIDDIIARCDIIAKDANARQGVALLRAVNCSQSKSAFVMVEPFDLPAGYLLVQEANVHHGAHAFECGIAPDGSVSS